ncbi:MAG: succinate dehydrogenase iron-sulfur subunit [Chitinispirillaceae bacterium]|jgi:succinate dehydrogenase / fumarate reductase iron-sulfur subunit|nr:succinate dehydrogenase iron-sulfur subunit [Chitinispirillaceae bacterium]
MSLRTFKIFRYNPATDDKPRYQNYRLDVQPSWSVLDCLNELHGRVDPTLSFRRSCRGGICGSCAMNINGKNNLACETLVQTLKKGAVILKPLPFFEIIKDLIVDFSAFFKAVEEAGHFCSDLPPGEKSIQSPEERKKLDGLYECILCGACTSACPSFWYNEKYPGPAALLKTCKFVEDSRDTATAQRLDSIDHTDGVWRCHLVFNCAEACPKALNPAAAINTLKQRIFIKKRHQTQ